MTSKLHDSLPAAPRVIIRTTSYPPGWPGHGQSRADAASHPHADAAAHPDAAGAAEPHAGAAAQPNLAAAAESRAAVRAAAVAATMAVTLALSAGPAAGAAPAPQGASNASFEAAVQAVERLPQAAPLQMPDLSRRARIRDTALAPDGRQLAWIEADGPNLAIKVMPLPVGASASAPASAPAAAARQLAQFQGRAALAWSHDGTILFVDSGDALTAIDSATGTATRIADLAPQKKRTFVMADPVRPHAALITDTAAATQTITRVTPATGTAGATGSSSPAIPALASAGTVTGSATATAAAASSASAGASTGPAAASAATSETIYSGRPLDEFLLAPDGSLAFALWSAPDGAQVVARRSSTEWKELTRCPQFEPCTLVAATPDGQHLQLLATIDGNRKGLVDIDSATAQRRAVFDDPDAIADTLDVTLNPATGQPLLARLAAPTRHVAAIASAEQTTAADLARRFKDSNIAVQASAGPLLIEEYGPRQPQPRYWLYDRTTHGVTEVLGQVRAAGQPLAAEQLAPTLPVSWRARDGATIHGYLTLPPGRKAAEVPLLTMAHGGPWARMDYGFSSLAQLVASRGVAVFIPNFRASTGHGSAYMRAPGARFGNGPAQTDIIDGVRWLQAQGIGDPKRLAIMGDSFGGYAVLLALTQEPELFQFGMAMSAPTDFAQVARALAQQVPVEAARMRYVGLDTTDTAAMDAIAADAPARHAAQVKRPLYLIAGGKDDKVDAQATRAYAAALQEKNGNSVTLLLDPEEGHFPRKPIAREGYVYALETLLHRHFGTAAPAAPSPALAAYLQQNTLPCCGK